MIKINKQKTYLHLFEDHSKYQYGFKPKNKWIGWLLLCLLSIIILIVPQIPVTILVGLIAFGISSVAQFDLIGLYETPVGFIITMLLSTGFSIICYYIYVKFVEKRPFYTIGLRQPRRLFKYLIGTLIAIGMQLTYFIIILITGFGEIVEEPIISTNGIGVNAIGIVLLALLMFLIQGASEEIMVRGWLFPALAKSYSAIAAIIISSGLFAVLHLSNDHVSMIAMFNLFLYGVFAVLYALNEGGLWGIFAFHSIWNWFMGNVIGLPVSGLIPGGASIIETKLVGPEVITGGAFGPEGGIIVSVMLSVAILVLIKMCFNKGILFKGDKEIFIEEEVEETVQPKIYKPIESPVIENSNGEIEMDFI